MSSYWAEFELDFTLDMSRLVPHLAAIEAGQAVASLRIIPPQWREKSSEEAEAALRQIVITHTDALENEIRLRKFRSILANSSQAHKWVKDRFSPGCEPMCVEDILQMHRSAADEAGMRLDVAGVMRRRGQEVTTGSEETGFHPGAPGATVAEWMQRYIQFINGKRLACLPPVVHALVAAFFITTIHPFPDGNGRISRLVAAAILYRRGYNGHGLHALSSFFYENEVQYHRILNSSSQRPCPDLTEFVAFGMEALAAELQGINSFIKVKLNRISERQALAGGKSKAIDP